jgi:hypothetical protein
MNEKRIQEPEDSEEHDQHLALIEKNKQYSMEVSAFLNSSEEELGNGESSATPRHGYSWCVQDNATYEGCI